MLNVPGLSTQNAYGTSSPSTTLLGEGAAVAAERPPGFPSGRNEDDVERELLIEVTHSAAHQQRALHVRDARELAACLLDGFDGEVVLDVFADVKSLPAVPVRPGGAAPPATSRRAGIAPLPPRGSAPPSR